MGKKIKAIDGATVGINGVQFPIPKGTEFNISKGNASGLAVTETEMNGDGSSTAKYTRIRGSFTGLVVRLSDTDHEDQFNDAFGAEDHLITLSNGDSTYSIESGIMVSPQDNGTPEVNQVTRVSEAFEIVSSTGYMVKRTIA